jgi:hypothetical protein
MDTKYTDGSISWIKSSHLGGFDDVFKRASTGMSLSPVFWYGMSKNPVKL